VAVMTYAKAIGLALAEAMAQDERVFCLGEDVGYGGAYGATQGLRDRFGAERVRDTPISEIAIVGFSVGAAVAGWRPVPEIMHFDFIAIAMDQVVNQAAKMRYMFGGKATLPIVIRCATGGWVNAAAQHSQSLEAWFTHIPGLKVASAGTPSDIRNLLLAAIRDDNPVMVQESLSLYEESGEVPDAAEDWTLGKAIIKREGTDVTLLTWGAMTPRVLEAAESLVGDGFDPEVIDLISLYPWDRDAVLASVAKTHRLVVTHQATRRGGFGGEIAAEVAERGFDLLDAPILRIGALNTPIPFSPPLEEFVLPTAARVVDAVRSMV
jgi:acetoin:2,6-dichlorophenolindophenol oxidoreductase subunit beta